MEKRAQLANLLGNMFSSAASREVIFSARVVEVTDSTCTVEYSDFELSDVRLQPITSIEGNEVLITPAIDSYVLVASAMGNLSNLWVVHVGVIERIDLICDDISVVVDNAGIVLNGGSLGGMVVVGELVNKLNIIESQLNSLKLVFKSWIPTPSDGGAALKSSVAGWAGKSLKTTQIVDVENKKIKQ